MRFAVWVLATCLLVLDARSEEVPRPEFASPPTEYASRYAGSLLVGDKTEKELKFWFNVEGANHHQCYMAGTASREDEDTFVFFEKECRLTIKIVGEAVVLLDQCNRCHEGHCGTRAYIDGATFFRKATANNALEQNARPVASVR